MDLRTEPVVLIVPPVEKDRYFSIQLIDAYTHNFDYIGSRTTGNDGGNFLVVGPNWDGPTPKGVKKVIRSETEWLLAPYRTQLFQSWRYRKRDEGTSWLQGTAALKFLGLPAPEAAPAIEFIKPLTPDEQKSSLEFFEILNFTLQFLSDPSDREETYGKVCQDWSWRGNQVR